MGNLTFSITQTIVVGNRKMAYGTVTGSGSYATNGDSYTAGDFKMITVEQIIINRSPTDNFYDADEANLKIKAYVASTNTEVANTTDISSVTARFVAFGI